MELVIKQEEEDCQIAGMSNIALFQHSNEHGKDNAISTQFTTVVQVQRCLHPLQTRHSYEY